MTCLWVGSSSASPRRMKNPSRATTSSASSMPSRRTPSHPSPGTSAAARDHEDLLVGVAHQAGRSRGAPWRPRAAPDGVARPGRRVPRAGRATRRSRSAEPAHDRAAMASAFEAAISAPIVASPRARRVASRHPVAARPAAAGQSSGRLAPVPATASTSATDASSGRWLIAATRRSCLPASSSTGTAPAGKRQRPHDARVAAAHGLGDHPRAVAEQAGIGRVEPAGLATRHRVAAHERDARLGRGRGENGLRRRHVGHGRPG